jgi:hypothetical protein
MSIKVTGKLLYSLTFIKKHKEYNFQRVFKFPRPIYVSEFEILGQIVWDHQIKLYKLTATANREFSSCTYKFATPYDEYGRKREKAFEKSFLDLNRIFCATIFSPLLSIFAFIFPVIFLSVTSGFSIDKVYCCSIF